MRSITTVQASTIASHSWYKSLHVLLSLIFAQIPLQLISRASSSPACSFCASPRSSACLRCLWRSRNKIPAAPRPDNPLDGIPNRRPRSALNYTESLDTGGDGAHRLAGEGRSVVSQADEVGQEDRSDQRGPEPETLGKRHRTHDMGELRECGNNHSSENGELGVCDETHGAVVVALDPHLDAPRDIVKGGRWRSRLPGCSGLRGWGAERGSAIRGMVSDDIRDKLWDDVGAEEGEGVEEGEGSEWDDRDCGDERSRERKS